MQSAVAFVGKKLKSLKQHSLVLQLKALVITLKLNIHLEFETVFVLAIKVRDKKNYDVFLK